MAEEKEKPQKKKQRFELTEIATETAPAYKDNEAGTTITQIELLLAIANDVAEIKKNLG